MIKEFKTRQDSLGKAMCDAVSALEKSTENDKEEKFRALVAAAARFSVYLGEEMETDNIDKLIEELDLTKAEHADDPRLDARAGVFCSSIRDECDLALNVLKGLDVKTDE